MDPVDIARWQFGVLTVYHYRMVPLTLGLGPVVAIMQTLWVSELGQDRYLRMTQFWGKALPGRPRDGQVVTGIVQEFQFWMAWSTCSRFVGDVFGAPLAMEGCSLSSSSPRSWGSGSSAGTGLPKRLHLAALWIAVAGSIVSAFFIIVANSWMHHGVGVELVDGRLVLVDIGAVLAEQHRGRCLHAHPLRVARRRGGVPDRHRLVPALAAPPRLGSTRSARTSA
ncbi:cytochrome ubiquinol oxidase subunit I [Rathayibacter oskolensis]|uniref:cytochrome ubiquinol oxidase subunit I n=1 Tax=Rathayibacter oskolensis TaxID=1891671 RepID=UPI00265E00CA|nr:cytochrome ubiquinol oxidase subunit I [Rathayibacter oskolensis]WKK71326.1 cytochrome ubiquinol oxidase subunit I [Rathayibacter oskolensis]